MGRKKKIPLPPENFRDYLKKSANWELVVKALTQLAFGGVETTNYNGQKIVTQPSIEAMKMIMQYSWGRPTEISEADYDYSDLSAKLADVIKNDMKHKPTETENNDNEN